MADVADRARDVLYRSSKIRPDRLDLNLPQLPPISDLTSTLPTPPGSSEMIKRHSFSSFASHDDEHDRRDHVVIPTTFGPIDSSHALFGPYYSPGAEPARRGDSPSPHSEAEYPSLPPTNDAFQRAMSGIVADFEHAIAQHSHGFRERYPKFRGPSIDDYRSAADFREEIHARAPAELRQHSSPLSRPRGFLPERPPLRSRESDFDFGHAGGIGRMIAPRPPPIYPTSPVSQYSPLPPRSSKRPHRTTTDPMPKRGRIGSTVSWTDDDLEDTPPKKRRSTTGSSRRRSSAAGAAGSKQDTKHNRNRSTKEKKSTNYLDYPGNIAPAFDTMKDPMEAAAQCPEHNVANPRNINQDPLKDELHESERIIAQKLNIDCSYFLCVKRQIFQRYLEHLKTKTFNWNKTAAQQCSNVDVGKTSQIFTFFNRVGWFNEELYKDKV